MTRETKVKSAQRTLRLLELLAKNRSGISFTDIQEFLDIPKSSAHSLIQELIENGYLVANTGKKTYYAGLEFLKLCTTCIKNTDLLDELKLLTDNIGIEIGQTTHSGVLAERSVMYLTKYETNSGLSLMNNMGIKLPAHCTGLGKILLSALSDEKIESLYKNYSFPKMTKLSIDNFVRLNDTITTIRKIGFAEEVGEASIYTACIAKPVKANGEVVAAVSVTFPIDLYNNINKEEILKVMSKHIEVTENRLFSM